MTKIIDKLKIEATELGIDFHPNIGEQTLKERIATKKAELPTIDSDDNDEPETQPADEPEAAPVKESEADFRRRKIKEANRLIRVRVSNMNPLKKALQGEILSAGNSIIGTVKKFILFDHPYHVPAILLGVMKDTKFRQSKTVKVNGKDVKRNIFINEYSIEYLDPLTPKQVQKIADRQSVEKHLEE